MLCLRELILPFKKASGRNLFLACLPFMCNYNFTYILITKRLCLWKKYHIIIIWTLVDPTTLYKKSNHTSEFECHIFTKNLKVLGICVLLHICCSTYTLPSNVRPITHNWLINILSLKCETLHVLDLTPGTTPAPLETIKLNQYVVQMLDFWRSIQYYGGSTLG